VTGALPPAPGDAAAGERVATLTVGASIGGREAGRTVEEVAGRMAGAVGWVAGAVVPAGAPVVHAEAAITTAAIESAMVGRRCMVFLRLHRG
jgi:hypothetical protein